MLSNSKPIQVIVSVVLLMSIVFCRQVHTISLWTAGRGAFQQLYGALRATATHVGILQDCRKLGLGAANAWTWRAALATLLSWAIPGHVCKNLHNICQQILGYPKISQQDLGYPSFDDLSLYIPGYPTIKQKQTGYHGITSNLTKTDGISLDNLTCDFSQDIPPVFV